MYIIKWKKPIWKSYIMYIIPVMWDSGKGKTMTAAETSVIARNWREGKLNRQSKEDFQGSENTLYDTTVMSIWALHICPNPWNT